AGGADDQAAGAHARGGSRDRMRRGGSRAAPRRAGARLDAVRLAANEFDEPLALVVDLRALGAGEAAQRGDLESALAVDVPGRRDEAVDEDRGQDVPVLPDHRA